MNYFLHDDPRVPQAWGPWFSHEYINYFSVLPLLEVWKLPPVRVTRNPFQNDAGWPLGPGHIDLFKENYRESRKLDPFLSFDYSTRNGDFSRDTGDRTAEPWQVLVNYATEPDLDLDYNLQLHKRQRLTGGSHGWRHMCFRVMGMRIGIARDSFLYQRDQARRAFMTGSDYWGWRFLSRSTHYLADLGNPFHVKASPRPLLLRHIRSTKKLLRIITAAHHSYEVYTEHRFREGFVPFRDALVRGSEEGSGTGKDASAVLDQYIRNAERRLDPLFNYFIDQYGQELIDAYSSMDRNSHLDAAAGSQLCSGEAAGIIFRESNVSKLRYLDDITAGILYDVGRMLGMLIREFVS